MNWQLIAIALGVIFGLAGIVLGYVAWWLYHVFDWGHDYEAECSE
jgi:hypothetical protein